MLRTGLKGLALTCNEYSAAMIMNLMLYKKRKLLDQLIK